MFGIDEARYREIARMNRNINGEKFLLLKAAEEASELSAAILQHLSKGVSLERVLQEMVDVHLTMSNLLSFLPEETMHEYAQSKVRLILDHIEQVRLSNVSQQKPAPVQQTSLGGGVVL